MKPIVRKLNYEGCENYYCPKCHRMVFQSWETCHFCDVPLNWQKLNLSNFEIDIMMKDFVEKVNILCRAIFFDPRKMKKNQKVFEYVHNLYCTSDEYDLELMDELAEEGYMYVTDKIKTHYHWVSPKGFNLLSKIYKIEFEKKEVKNNDII